MTKKQELIEQIKKSDRQQLTIGLIMEGFEMMCFEIYLHDDFKNLWKYIQKKYNSELVRKHDKATITLVQFNGDIKESE